MVEREATGIENLDDVLDGGIPKGFTVLLIGSPGSGKSFLSNQFLDEGLAEGQGGLYVTLDTDPEEIIENSKEYGWSFKENRENLKIMDAYSWKLGEEVEGKYTVEGPSDLNQLNMTFTDALEDLEDLEKRIIIDSISTLILYTDPKSTAKFLQVISAKSKSKNGVLLIAVEEGVHEEKTMSTLNYTADGVIKLKEEAEKRYFSVSRMDRTDHSKDWKEIEKDN